MVHVPGHDSDYYNPRGTTRVPQRTNDLMNKKQLVTLEFFQTPFL
jgi:hypothetical protein